ncbi:hypothetical protein BDN67DRAFT_428439 [Paxillus ammoniavirescens]|nr:hypothetical protein BDN67DRAFT_428439 [Paxillus ammoniavirescens]
MSLVLCPSDPYYRSIRAIYCIGRSPLIKVSKDNDFVAYTVLETRLRCLPALRRLKTFGLVYGTCFFVYGSPGLSGFCYVNNAFYSPTSGLCAFPNRYAFRSVADFSSWTTVSTLVLQRWRSSHVGSDLVLFRGPITRLNTTAVRHGLISPLTGKMVSLLDDIKGRTLLEHQHPTTSTAFALIPP